MSFTPLSLEGKKYEISLSPSLRSTCEDVRRDVEKGRALGTFVVDSRNGWAESLIAT